MRSAKTQLVGGISLLFVSLVFIFYSQLSFAQDPTSPWLNTTGPSVERISEIDLRNPLQISIISNRDCYEREVITRPQRYVAPLQAKISHQGCVTDTGYGAISQNGYLQRAGSQVSGELRTSKGDRAIMMPVPRHSTGIRLSGGSPYGNFLFFYDNLPAYIKSTALYNGEVEHRLPENYSAILKNGSELLSVDSSTMSFSASGDWMVADIPFLAMVRINTKTREILPFEYGSNPFIVVGAAYRTAISPDGRYAVVASKNSGLLKIYDLNTCGAVPAEITGKVTCSSYDLLPTMRQKIPGFTSIASMRFRSNYTIDLYANYITGNESKLTRYVATAAGQQKVGFQYLALGDSFASGEGAYEYKASTDTGHNMCHLSQRSYPYLISSTLGFGQYESVACSGAVMKDVTDNSAIYRKENEQSKGKFDESFDNEIFTNFLPGYRAQNEFNRLRMPGIITVSIGGNDIGFGDIIIRCIDTDTCYDNYEDRMQLVGSINRQFNNLVSTYIQIKTSADPRTKIYIIGYPQIAKPDGVCDMNVHLNNEEVKFAAQLVTHLNSVIKKAAENAGVYYVDVEDSLNGHRMCEPMWSWEVAVNGLTAGNDKIDLPYIHGPIGNESYHPNAMGHDLLKQKILEKTNNLTATMPPPNPNAKPSDITSDMAILQAPKTNRVIRDLKHYTGTDGGVIKAGERWVYEATYLDEIFAAGSKVEAWLHSNPLNLGTYTMSPDGSINISADIPTNMAPGFHTLHLYGKNSSGEDIDLFKTVFVQTNSACLVPISGQDSDKDGTDDACDGFIDKTPLTITSIIPAVEALDTTDNDATEKPEVTPTQTPNQQETTSPQTTQTLVLAATPQPDESTQAATLGTSQTITKSPTTETTTPPQTETIKVNKTNWLPIAILTLSALSILAFLTVIVL